MRIFLTRTFQKSFEKLPRKAQNQVEEAVGKIHQSPHSGKRLLGVLIGEYSFRVGKYRIIYSIDRDENIWVEAVRHRKDAYRKP
jgi:mRNA interferase RelE/StbE